MAVASSSDLEHLENVITNLGNSSEGHQTNSSAFNLSNQHSEISV